jgi:hypothetical protein
VASGDFVGYCQKQAQNIPAGLDKATLCKCVQQKLVAAGYGNQHVNDPSFKAAPTTVIAPCFTGGSSGSQTPGTPSTPSTTTT